MSAWLQEPADRWEPWTPEIRLSGGPERIYDDSPKPEPPLEPFGFVAAEEPEPLAWEGDYS